MKLAPMLVFGALAWSAAAACLAEQPGQSHLDEALRSRVNVESFRDLNAVVEQLEQALDKGLDVQDTEFAEQMLSGVLLERAKVLAEALAKKRAEPRQRQVLRRSAQSDLRRVLAYDDPPAEARLLLAQLSALPGGDRHEARRELDRYLETEDLDVEQRAEALMLRGRVQTSAEKALADFDRAIELAPEEVAYQLTRVLFLRSQKRGDEAFESIRQVAKQHPDHAAAAQLEGEILREQGDLEPAIAALERARELAPDSAVPVQHQGEIYRELEQYDKAIEKFTAAAELAPEADTPLIHRAEAWLQLEKIDKALADVDAVLEKHPDHVAAARMKAEIFFMQKKIDKAIEVMQETSRLAPRVPEVSLQLAIYRLLNKQPQEAIEAYSQALIADPENFLALRGRADSYLSVGDHHAALVDFERAIQVKAEDPELLNNFAWLLATSPDDDVRDGARAVKLAAKAAELTEYQRPHVLSTLAAAYAESGDFDAARKWSQKAVDMNDPEHGEQLKKELESYREEKPWRERQTAETSFDAPTADDSTSESAEPTQQQTGETQTPQESDKSEGES